MPAIEMLWKARDRSQAPPLIGDQYVSMGKQILCLRNPMPSDSAFMGKMFAVTIFWSIGYLMHMFSSVLLGRGGDLTGFLICMTFPLGISAFLFWRIYLIRSQSNYFFNRHTQKIYYRKKKHLYIGDWRDVQAGMCTQMEFSGRSFSVSYSLLVNAFDNTPNHPDNPDTRYNEQVMVPVRSILIDSNEPSDPRVTYVAQVWSYIQHFMEHGPDGLPVPKEPHWWTLPHNRICLTPAQAWRHYAPWRTGEPGEMQGKKWWLLPFWLLTFPYNLFAALCWWVTCKLFRVRPMDAPLEAMEGETAPLVTIEMAKLGMRP